MTSSDPLFAASQYELSLYREAIEAIPIGVVVVDTLKDREVVLLNSAAAAICHAATSIHITPAGFMLAEPGDDERLTALLRGLTEKRPHEADASKISVAHDKTRRLIITVKPLSHSPELSNLAVLLITPPLGYTAPTHEALQQAWALTVAEAKLAVALVKDGYLRSAAKTCGITEGTARQYLKRIYNKADVRGQVDLIRKAIEVGINSFA